MRRRGLREVVIGLCVFAVTFGSVKAGDSVREVVSPDAKVQGLTQPQWTERWWQWASSFDYSSSPVSDRSGERCGAGQKGRMWFLAGVYGSAPVKRRCVVPAGTYLFFPILNYIVTARPDGQSTCDSLMMQAKDLTDGVDDLTLQIDGVSVAGLGAHRQATDSCFDLFEGQDEAIAPSAGNGYYVMLQPLEPGRHTLRWGGRLNTLVQAVVYELDVVEAGASAQPVLDVL